MYRVHDYVVCGSDGVCQIKDISQLDFGSDEDREYYVLNSVYGNSIEIFIPTDKKNVNMRPVMSKDEIYELFKDMPELSTDWFDDNKRRKAMFSEILQSSNLTDIIQMVRTIYDQKVQLEKEGKLLSNVDVEILKLAEKQLYNEFALVFDIKPEKIVSFVMENIENYSSHHN